MIGIPFDLQTIRRQSEIVSMNSFSDRVNGNDKDWDRDWDTEKWKITISHDHACRLINHPICCHY